MHHTSTGEHGYHDCVRRPRRPLAALTIFIVIYAPTLACSARSSTTEPVAQQPEGAAGAGTLPSDAVVTPEPTSTPPVVEQVFPETQADECAVVPDSGQPIATVGLTDPVNPANAPRPTNDGEQLLFRQLYETLIRVDCAGRAVPGLAESWRLDGDTRTWILTLREGARFSDGSPLTANDVRDSWLRDGGDGLRLDVARLVQEAAAVSERELAVVLQRHRADAPVALAHQDLAVARRIATSPWPQGTRVGWAVTEERRQGSALSAITLARGDASPIQFLIAQGDPRDLIDRNIDLLLTRDPASLDYAATLPQFQSVPLAWQRTQVLLAPGRPPSSPSLSPEARQALADDAVRGEARGAEGPFWWQALSDCILPAAPRPSQATLIPRVVYDARDGAARDLAERLVGLTRTSSPAAQPFLDALLPDRPRRTYQRTAGLAGEALAAARGRGADAAYITSIDSRPLDACRELQTMMETMPWLDPQSIVPLVDTRLRAIVRRERGGVTADWDGGLLLSGAGARNPA